MGSPINLITPYSILRPASVAASDFLPTAFSAFNDYLGFASCSTGAGTVATVVLTSIVNGSQQTSRISTLASTTASATPAISSLSQSRPHLAKRAEVGIGVAVPLVAIGLLSLAILLWRRLRRSRKANTIKAEEETPEDDQPYLQRKAELEAEEKRKYELEAAERRYELDGDSNIHEIPVGLDHQGMPSLAMRQELRGEEHSKELGGP